MRVEGSKVEKVKAVLEIFYRRGEERVTGSVHVQRGVTVRLEMKLLSSGTVRALSQVKLIWELT